MSIHAVLIESNEPAPARRALLPHSAINANDICLVDLLTRSPTTSGSRIAVHRGQLLGIGAFPVCYVTVTEHYRFRGAPD